MPNTEADKMTGVGLAGGAVVSALLDTLYAKGILSLEESRSVLSSAMNALAPHQRTPAGYEASQIIAALMRVRFSQRGENK
jgi:hypothetical protein